MRNFRDLNVWQDSIRLTKEIYRITSKLPKSEMYGLASQMNRAVVSIPSIIAEGSSKDSQKEYRSCFFIINKTSEANKFFDKIFKNKNTKPNTKNLKTNP